MSPATGQRKARAALLALALASGFAGGCGDEGPRAPVAFVTPRAALVIEPPQLALGATASVEIAVATPPDHRVAPIAPPDEVGGLWILEVLAPEIEMRRERWTHRFRFHVRSRATGRFVWPETEVPVERPDGSLEVLRVAARPFEVLPVLSEETGPHRFLPLRAPGPEPAGSSVWLGALGGAVAALLGVAGVAALRRRRRAGTGPAGLPAPPSRRQTGSALAAARELAGDDPRRAADMISAALRLHVERRLGIPALSATTPELHAVDAASVRGLAPQRLERVLALLDDLDALRFAAGAEEPGDDAARVADAAQRATELVAEEAPRGAAAVAGEPR